MVVQPLGKPSEEVAGDAEVLLRGNAVAEVQNEPAVPIPRLCSYNALHPCATSRELAQVEHVLTADREVGLEDRGLGGCSHKGDRSPVATTVRGLKLLAEIIL